MKTSLIVGTTNIENSSNKLFLLAASEVLNFTVSSPIGSKEIFSQEGSQYEYYANFDPNTSDYNDNAIKYYLSDNPPSPDWFDEMRNLHNDIGKNGKIPTDEELEQLLEYVDWLDNKSAIWRLRTPYIDSNMYFFVVEIDKLNMWKNPYSNKTELGISFAFCF